MGLVDDNATGRQLHSNLHWAGIIGRMDTDRMASTLIRVDFGNLRQCAIKVLGAIKRQDRTELFPREGIGRSGLGFLHEQDLDIRHCAAVNFRHLGNLVGGSRDNGRIQLALRPHQLLQFFLLISGQQLCAL